MEAEQQEKESRGVLKGKSPWLQRFTQLKTKRRESGEAVRSLPRPPNPRRESRNIT